MIMRFTAQLKAAALIGLAVMVGLLGVGGTWALWNAAIPSAAGTVQAADFDIRLNGDSTATTITAIPESGALLTPSTPVYARVDVQNASNAGAPMTVAAVMSPPQVLNPSTPTLGSTLSVRAAPAPTSGSCAGAQYTQSNTSATITIDQTKTGRFCLRMALPAGVAPTGLTSATAKIATTVTITQQPRGQ
jgi:hypothetical protein